MPSSSFSKITFSSAATSIDAKNSATHYGCNHGVVSTIVAGII